MRQTRKPRPQFARLCDGIVKPVLYVSGNAS